ncbi:MULTISPECIES: ectoine synthase [Streptomyces]|uniref:L-ectoine synthase n=2 Tax=Streptomyces TaxID=1883 RepID=A0ABY6Q127_9ACTN|nr:MULTISPECIES: ectoine synthase [Streptomyces]MCX0241629.1 ectoine synthase [Streptomyces drozdowiczii]OKJ67415.1 ectoine synthase [Streptomyces sp. CB02460]UZK58143.1 ectoine synthase [Streptomyces drozdowiczii]
MIIRDLETVKSVDWGNGLSRRFLTESDGVGYSITDTTVRAGTKSRLEYRNHLESCYCIEGSGEVVELDGTVHPITPGRLYSLDQHDAHYLVASPHEDLRLVCVFTPALQGDEVHSLDAHTSSAY